VQGQQHCSVYFCTKIIFKSWFFWLIWPFECLILMFLTMAKYHENLLKDSTLSLLLIVKFFSSLKTKMILKTPNETFLRITRYKLCIVGHPFTCPSHSMKLALFLFFATAWMFHKLEFWSLPNYPVARMGSAKLVPCYHDHSSVQSQFWIDELFSLFCYLFCYCYIFYCGIFP